jgi:hypothetical protein
MNKETAEMFMDMLKRINKCQGEIREQQKAAVLQTLQGYVQSILED